MSSLRLLCLFSIFVMLILIGCSGDDENVTEDPNIYNITLLGSEYGNCGTDTTNTCQNFFEIDFEDHDPYNYYRVALYNSAYNHIEVFGGYREQPGSLLLYVTYADSVPGGVYAIRIYKFRTKEDVIKINNSVGYGELAQHVTIRSVTNFEDCFTHCCTPNEMLEHFYVQVKSSIENVIGASCFIRPRYGSLCGEQHDVVIKSSSIAYIAINDKLANGDLVWAQFGVGTRRETGQQDPFNMKFWEVIDSINEDRIYDPIYLVPGEPNEPYKLQLELNNSVGLWEFRINDASTPWASYTTEGWRNRFGEDIRWAGEIYYFEDDMPGTEENKFSFTDCKYRVGTSYDEVDFGNTYQTSFRCDDTKQWDTSTTQTSLRIWDVNPLP